MDLSGTAMHDTRKINPGFIVRPTSTVITDDGDVDTERDGDDVRDSREENWR